MESLPTSNKPTTQLPGLSVDGAETAVAIWQQAQSELMAVEALLKRYVAASGRLNEAAVHHLATGGKRLRPLLVLATGEALQCNTQIRVRLAAAVELLHNASLIHDDLQDKDPMRRGQPTVWHKYGTDTAINLGDYLISSTYQALADLPLPGQALARIVALFATSTHQIIQGQSDELDASGCIDTSVEQYAQIVTGKSGVMMALPVLATLLAAETPAEICADARAAMESLGMAYQIQDDLDDLFGLKEGRSAGVDLREGRISLPILQFYRARGLSMRQDFRRFIERTTPANAAELELWIDQIKGSAAPRHCLDLFEQTRQTALQHLGRLPDPLRSVLHQGQSLLLNASRERYSLTDRLASAPSLHS